MNLTYVTIGRESNNHVVLNSPTGTISGNHGTFTVYDTGRIVYQDHSANGTMVDNKKVHKTEVEVKRNQTQIVFPEKTPVLFSWSLLPVFPKLTDDVKLVKTVGRDKENSMVIDNERISRKHATVKLYKDGKVTLYDESTNGTTVNGTKAQRWRETPVKRGDKISFAGVMDFDWKLIPSDSKRRILIFLLSVIGLLGLGYGAYKLFGTTTVTNKCESKNVSNIDVYGNYSVYVMVKALGKVKIGSKVFYFGKDLSGINSLVEESDKKNLKPFTWSGTAFGVGDASDGIFCTNYHVAEITEKKKFTDSTKAYFINMQINHPDFLKQILMTLAQTGDNIEPLGGEIIERYIVKQGTEILEDEQNTFNQLPDRAFFKVDLKRGIDKYDLAVLQVHDINARNLFSYLPLSKISTEKTELMSPVVRWGYPGFTLNQSLSNLFDIPVAKIDKLTPQVSTGTITEAQPESFEFRASYQAGGGSSGSPVYDNCGNLIGIHHMGPGQMVTNSTAIHSKYLVEMLNDAGYIKKK